MKTLLIIPLLSFVLLTAGCVRGDFWGTKVIIINKSQNSEDKEKKQAHYTIKFGDSDKYNSLIFIDREDLGEPGDIVMGMKVRTPIVKPSLVEGE